MSNKNSEFKDIIEYYDHTRFDYKVAWDNSSIPSTHFGYYDENSKQHSDALTNMNKILAEYAQVQEGDKILDAGCGRGGSCFWLAMHKNAETIGITPVQSQVDDCIHHAAALELKKPPQFIVADYCNTPFEDQSFDVVWACESLCHAKDKFLFYQEAFRLLRPGGRLIIAEYLRTQRPLKNKDETLLQSWLNGWAIEDIDTQKEHLNHATKAGFQNIQIHDITKNVNVSLRNLYKKSKLWLWLSKILQLLRIRSKVQHANIYASIQQYKALEKKLWFYSIISAIKK